MDDESDGNSNKVGYGRPPEHGKIKPGERRNPAGRRGKGKKPKMATDMPSDTEILAKIDSEIVEVNGQKMSKRELELRTQHSRSLKGNVAASKILQAVREKAKADKPKQGGGVLVVPGISDIDKWCVAAELQQRQFREGHNFGDHIKTAEDYIKDEMDRIRGERAMLNGE